MTRILLAVSGGIDSMYLANRAPELFPGARFAVAHCNFALRGAESDADEAFVRAWCAEHDLECFVKRFDTRGYAAQHGVSMLRGTGTRGLRGMGDRDGIVRPLLDIPREDIRAWMTARGLAWRDDSTNADSTPKRNRIRNEVFPVFARINPSFVRTLGDDMRRFARVDDIADSYFRAVREGLTTPSGDIRLPAVLALEHWEYVLWRLLEKAGLSGPTFEKLVALLRRYKDAPRGTVTIGGKTFEGTGTVLRIEKELLIIP